MEKEKEAKITQLKEKLKKLEAEIKEPKKRKNNNNNKESKKSAITQIANNF